MSTEPNENFDRYLKIYNADIDWTPHMVALRKNVQKQIPDTDAARIEVRNRISYTILQPAYDKSCLTDPRQNLLFWCYKYHGYLDKDWYAEYVKIFNQDQSRIATRDAALALGFVYPVKYNPVWRQAGNWLIEHANDDPLTEDAETAATKLENLLLIYGGQIVSNVFQKPELAPQIKKIANWRTGYFFERLIHRVYKPEEILRIKQNDIDVVKRADERLVKYLNK